MHHKVPDGPAMWNFMVAWGQVSRGVAIDPVPVHDHGCRRIHRQRRALGTAGDNGSRAAGPASAVRRGAHLPGICPDRRRLLQIVRRFRELRGGGGGGAGADGDGRRGRGPAVHGHRRRLPAMLAIPFHKLDFGCGSAALARRSSSGPATVMRRCQ